MSWRFCSLTCILLMTMGWSTPVGSQQYRSKILIDPGETLEKGSVLSVEQLEQQLDSLTDAYARATTTRYLAQQYIERGEYQKAISYYQAALEAEGLADVADREILRELAQLHLMQEDYANAASVLEQVRRLDLVADKADFLLLAQARFRSGDYVATVIALDHLGRAELPLDEADLRQMLTLYYQSGAYSQSAGVLQKLLLRFPDNPEYWHQLAGVYLLQNQHREALDQLSLALVKRVPFREPDLLLLVDLYAYNEQPYTAASLLETEMERGHVSGDGEHYRKLFELWLQAREKHKAIDALAHAASLTGATELYLHLAQLQSENENWQAMQAAVLEACSSELDDRFVSRANLLLGISQLKMGDRQNARRSFINATLIGGATSQAAQWLSYMNAEPASPAEVRKIASPCYGGSDRRRKVTVTTEPVLAVQNPEVSVESIPAVSDVVATRIVPGQQMFTARYSMTPVELAEKVQGLATRLAISQVRAGGEIDGPLHILLETGRGVSDQVSDALLAFPTRGNPRSSGRYRTLSTEPFRCSYLVYEGSADGITTAWGELARVTLGAGHRLTGHARLVFSCAGDCTKDHLAVELQLGIE